MFQRIKNTHELSNEITCPVGEDSTVTIVTRLRAKALACSVCTVAPGNRESYICGMTQGFLYLQRKEFKTIIAEGRKNVNLQLYTEPKGKDKQNGRFCDIMNTIILING